MDNIYANVVTAAEKALSELLKSKEKSIKGNTLLDWVVKHPDEFDFNIDALKNSWGTYLTRAISDPDTKIAREPGKYSLVLKDKSKDLNLEPASDETENTETCIPEQKKDTIERQKREDALYKLLSEWFISRNYNAEVTAHIKKGDQWGNPDIVGIMLIDDPFGNQQIEIGTIEAKISLNNWRKEFFEAVSHKRFSNRAYFAFAVGAKEPSIQSIREYEQLRSYGEKYNVGILAVFMDAKDYQQLIKDDVSKLKLALDDVIVTEIWPAMYDLVSTSDLYFFVTKVLDLDTTTKVNNFGKR